MVICGQCNTQFETSEAELAHICSVTGVAPTDPRSMGANYEAIQAAALERGQSENATQADALPPISIS